MKEEQQNKASQKLMRKRRRQIHEWGQIEKKFNENKKIPCDGREFQTHAIVLNIFCMKKE